MTTKKENTKNENGAAHKFHAAFTKTAAARAALLPEQIIPINLDVQVATTTVLGTLPRLAMIREDIVSHLPEFDIAEFDRLETYAEALAYANTVVLAASQPTEALPVLAARATEIRQLFLSDATALARRALIDGKPLDELKGAVGYLNVAADIGVLVRMFRARWSEISTKSAVQAAELDEAEQIFERITFAYAERTQPSTSVASASDDRQRAYTLLVNAYDQARRAAIYLRWSEGDADKFAPSLWAGRGGRGANQSSNVSPAPPPIVAPNGAPPAPVAPQTNGTPGHPGGSPFIG